MTPLGPGAWSIAGNASLGDQRDTYKVLKGDEGYWCECFGNQYGDVRSRRSCSHVTGAMLWEQENPDYWDGGEIGDGDEQVGEEQMPVGEGSGENAPPSPPDSEVRQENPGPLTPRPGEIVHEVDLRVLDPDNPPLPAQVNGEEDTPLRGFDEYRPAQWRAIVEAVTAFEDGYKVVFLSAPTGAGKTLISESVRRLLDVRGVYTCTTKVLQDQVMRDFGYFAKLLKGRSNYQTLDDPTVTAADCMKMKTTTPACPGCPGYSRGGHSWGAALTSGVDEDPGDSGQTYHCNFCHPWFDCPYEKAKMAAARARLAVLNTSYLLTETNYAKGVFSQWPLVIIDEADKLEEELMRFVELSISPRLRRTIGVGLPSKKTVEQAWVDWLTDDVIPACEKFLDKPRQLTVDGQPNVKEMRTRKQVTQLLEEAKELTSLEPNDEGEMVHRLSEGWVYTGYEGKSNDDWITVTFKPIMVKDEARGLLWNHADHFLLMSATFVSPEQMAWDLGLEDGEWTVVDVPSSFPIERRPVFPRAVASVTAKTKGEAYPKVAKELRAIMREHLNERILVHTVSYELTNYLYEQVKSDRIYRYTSAQNRDQALADYLDNPRGVLLAPSFDRGVDLHADDCRVIVIAKTPFPYLGDKQVSQRTYSTRTGQTWYAVQTIRTICQMTGRGMRSADDWCRTYILDEQFTRLYQRNRRLFPEWWREAVVWDEHDPKWKGLAGSPAMSRE